MEHYVSPKKQSRRSGRRRGANTAHYASSISSFRGGTAVNAFCTVRDPSSDDPFATRSILIGLDSYSDITVAHRDIVYGLRPIEETVYTGAGACTYTEEGLVDIVGGFYSFRTTCYSACHSSMTWMSNATCTANSDAFPSNPTTNNPTSLSAWLFNIAWQKRIFNDGPIATRKPKWEQ